MSTGLLWRHVSFLRMAHSSAPILLGPWRSELGFEALYWLPWLAAVRARYNISRDRLIAVSRGGAGLWYDAAQTMDLYDYVPIVKLRQTNVADSLATGSIKQHRRTAWEQTLLPALAQDMGLRRYHVLHPSRMYQHLTPWWEGAMGQTDLLRVLRFMPIPVPAPPLTLPLPERYIAVRFYDRYTWRLTESLRTWVATLVEGLARHLPVVLLDCGLHADEHTDFPIQGANIQSLEGHVTVQNNLAVQSAVIAKAQAFIGTYGGTMQLAVRLGKPAVGFYEKFEGTAWAHKQLVEWVAMQQGTPCFIGRPDDARFVREMMQ